MKSINEFLLSKKENKIKVKEITSKDLLDNFPDTIKKVDWQELKETIDTLIYKQYIPILPTPFCKANRNNGCFYLFSSMEQDWEYVILSICSRTWDIKHAVDFPIIAYTSNMHSINTGKDENTLMMSWGRKHDNVLYNDQELVQTLLNNEDFEEYDDKVHKSNWWCKSVPWMDNYYNAVSFYK